MRDWLGRELCDGIHITSFENLCVARCRHNYGLRTSLAKEVKAQMSIVTSLPDVWAQSRAFISGRLKAHGMVTYIHK